MSAVVSVCVVCAALLLPSLRWFLAVVGASVVADVLPQLLPPEAAAAVPRPALLLAVLAASLLSVSAMSWLFGGATAAAVTKPPPGQSGVAASPRPFLSLLSLVSCRLSLCLFVFRVFEAAVVCGVRRRQCRVPVNVWL